MLFIFLNKYFIISTIIWCYACVFGQRHQNMMTETNAENARGRIVVVQAVFTIMPAIT